MLQIVNLVYAGSNPAGTATWGIGAMAASLSSKQRIPVRIRYTPPPIYGINLSDEDDWKRVSSRESKPVTLRPLDIRVFLPLISTEWPMGKSRCVKHQTALLGSLYAGVTQMVECYLCKLEVAGSRPVSGSSVGWCPHSLSFLPRQCH